MIGLLQTAAGNFGTGDMIMALVLGDIKDEQAVQRTRDSGGPSVSWHVLHMLAMRHVCIGLLGGEPDTQFHGYIQESASDGSDYPSVTELAAHWEKSREKLGAALEAATEEAARATTNFFGDPNKPVIDALSFLSFHEAYHIGALGAIRKEIGLAGPAELVMAQMAKAKAEGS